MTPRNKALFALFATACIWGFNPLMNKILLNSGTGLTIMSIRFLVGSFTIMLVLAYKKQLRFPPISKLPPLVFMGFLSVPLFNTLAFEGLRFSSITNYALINCLSPLSIAVLAFFFLRERLLVIQWLGITISLLSTAYLITHGNLTEISNLQFNQGDFIFFIAQFSWALYTLVSVKIINEMSVMEIVAWSGFFGACINITYGLFIGGIQMPKLYPESILALAYISWLNSMVAMILWNFGVKLIGPSTSGIFINLATLMSITTGVIIFHEDFDQTKIIGGMGILFGIILLTQANNILKWKKNRNM